MYLLNEWESRFWKPPFFSGTENSTEIADVISYPSALVHKGFPPSRSRDHILCVLPKASSRHDLNRTNFLSRLTDSDCGGLGSNRSDHVPFDK